MPVERNKDGSVTIRYTNGATSIGRLVKVSEGVHEEMFLRWVEECTRRITACDHTLGETEKYFLEQCETTPLDLNDMRMKSFVCNVVINHCKHKLKHQPSEFSFDMTDDEMEKWQAEQNAMQEEIMNSSPEYFRLIPRGYSLPRTERNEIFYEQAYTEAQKWAGRIKRDVRQITNQDICFFFEETTGQCQSSGGNKLMQQLIVYRGVSEEDIQKRSPQFLIYISTLREMGVLPK